MNKKKKYSKIKNDWGKLKAESFNFHLIERYFLNNNHAGKFQVITDKTMNDIDFQELFMFIDRTNTKIGQQYLYDKLLTIDANENFKEQENLIDYCLKNEQTRMKAQLLLSKLNNNEAYYISSLFQDEYIKKPEWFWLIPIFSVINLLSLVLTFISPQFFPLLLLVLIISMLFHYWNKKNIYVYTDSIPQLTNLLNTTKEFLKDHFDESAGNSLKSLETQKKGMFIFSTESKMNSDIGQIVWFVLEYLKIFFLFEPIVLFIVLKKLDSKRNDIHALFKYIGRIDTAISIASFRTGLNYFCKPDISTNHQTLNFEEIYHPLIVGCIANSLYVNGKSILLTGSNMSGKTTFIRTIAINVLCAQTINTCFAKRFALKPMQIYSAIRITDDLLDEKSYYFEEVRTIKEIIDASQTDCYKLFLLDEIFKGTNTVERIAAGKAVLSYIGKDKNITFVSTHDIELTDLLGDAYELYHFTETIEDDSIYFDYKLKKGNLATRNAIRILELNNYPDEIIDEAKKISKNIISSS